MSDAKPVTTVAYAERWSDLKREMVWPLAEKDARVRHDRGELYTALVTDSGRPQAYLDVRLEAGFVGVHFLDEELRNHLTYMFTRPEGEERDLFLETLSRRVYDDTGDLIHDEYYIFKPADRAHVKKRDHVTKTAETYDLETDLSENYEPVPDFGEYESIARVER